MVYICIFLLDGTEPEGEGWWGSPPPQGRGDGNGEEQWIWETVGNTVDGYVLALEGAMDWIVMSLLNTCVDFIWKWDFWAVIRFKWGHESGALGFVPW